MIEKANFGKTTEGEPVEIYTLTNEHAIKVRVMTYGGLITELHLPDGKGQFADVVLGLDNLDQYLKGHPHFGCITGRFANRIAKGKFTLHGREYSLAVNNGPNHLHGGRKGFDKRVWLASPVERDSASAVKLSYVSPDGEEGYPGNLKVDVTYVLTENDELILEYEAVTDQPTPVNLTNHSYFNLAGAGNGDVLQHQLRINADYYTPVDETSIPTGEIRRVADTVMDFRALKAIGTDFAKITGEPGGYDHNYVIRKSHPGELAQAAECYEPNSGRTMTVFTTEPGVQLYTGNFLTGQWVGKGGKTCHKHYGLCLECQHFPDSVNQPHFPSAILDPGSTYRQTTVHKFSWR